MVCLFGEVGALGLAKVAEWAREYVESETCVLDVPREQLSVEERAGLQFLRVIEEMSER